MPRRIRRISQARAASDCAWCRKPLAEEDEIYSLGAQAKPWVRLPDGGVIELSLDAAHQRVPAIVSAPGSEAKQAGNDLLFATCSAECVQALGQALRKQIDFAVTGD
jgi:hypothetical protein